MTRFSYCTVVIIVLCCLKAKSQYFDSLKIELDSAIDYIRSGEYKSVEPEITSLFTAIISYDNDTLKAKAFLGLYNLDIQNEQYDSALSHMNKSLLLFAEIRDSTFLGYCYRERSLRNLILGHYDQAIYDSQSAIELYNTMKDTVNWARSLSGLSNINHDIEEYELGIAYGHQALALLRAYSIRSADEMAYAMNCIAINYDDKGDSQKAIEFHTKVIDMKDEISDKGLARAYNNIGNSLMKLGRYDEAIGWLKQNLAINEKMGRKYGLATVKTNLGTLSYLNREFHNSQRFLKEAETLSYEIKDVEKIHDVLFQQYKLYQAWGKFENSLQYLEKFHFFKDSLLNETRVRQLTDTQTRYETALKQKEIEKQKALLAEKDATLEKNRIITGGLIGFIVLLVLIGLLQRNRSILKQQKLVEEEKTKIKESQIEAAINTQEEERKRFARDLHDGFGQMISVLNLNLSNLDSHPEKRQEVYQNSTEVLDQMYKELKSICFNLMPETLIKNGLTDAIDEFALRINNAGKVQIETNFFGMDERLGDVQEISLYRITQEWVNNVIKYSDAGSITIQLTKDEEEINLLIEDDGMGFDKTLLTQGSGNGWKNLNSRANLIKGVLELDTNPRIKGNTLIVDIIKTGVSAPNMEEKVAV